MPVGVRWFCPVEPVRGEGRHEDTADEKPEDDDPSQGPWEYRLWRMAFDTDGKSIFSTKKAEGKKEHRNLLV